MAAVEASGVFAIVSKGWSDRLSTTTESLADPMEPKMEMPPSIYLIDVRCTKQMQIDADAAIR